MRFEHSVVVPLSLPDARRLLDELERRVPVVPGLVVRVELAVIDARSTAVHLRGELPAIGGIGSALVLDTGMRLVRRYADQLVAAARARSAEATTAREPGAAGSAGTPSPASGSPASDGSARDSYTFGTPSAGGVRRLRDEPVVWGLGVLGLLIVAGRLRRKRH